MAKNRKYKNSGYFLTYSVLMMFIFGCASMRTPEGGPRDTTPPKVLKMEPKNFTTNFSAKKIFIDFDEYIKLQNEFKEFSVSPELETPAQLKYKLRRLEITLPDTLEKNTTYTLNFGKAITDINEGNILKNFTYVFSTGPTLDSLSISGNVRDAITLDPVLDATVLIFPLERDSLFGKKKASIFTSTDSSGNFKLNNLKKDKYKVYAIKENNGDRIYQQENDQLAFIKEPVTLNSNIDSIKLLLFKEKANNFRVTDRKINSDGSIFLAFNQQLNKPEITVTEPSNIDGNKLLQFTKNKDSVKFWLKDLSFDSVKIAIKDQGKLLESVKLTRGKRDTYTRNIAAADNLQSGKLKPSTPLKLTFNLPVENIDMSKVLLLEDSIPRNGFTLKKDSADLLSYVMEYPWKKQEKYILNIKPDAITGIFNSKNKEIIKSFTLADASDYSTLSLNIKVPDTSKNYIVEVVDEKKNLIYAESVNKNKIITLTNFKTGIYFARIIYDDNKNGKWDTGNLKTGLQPEKIWYEPKELSIRANWKREEIINIPK
ncbi:Ig-like domain-containing domain [Pedobacter montanisoli]|uniref:Ig-like domain-containing protein n=1 Tax=Pedobacter montanisoli TaxID=2923277 RepID=A0ABS9ZT26_9SPHI|nr:Ig-like domain-containing domain [Pedobacter montanisoli]MCJ0741737.1 Ig-like domain-containing protein [Pedobacter montanisoli]